MTHGSKQRMKVYGVGVMTLTGAVMASLAMGSAPTPDTSEPVINIGTESVHVLAAGRIQAGPVISGSLQPERSAAVRAEVGGVIVATNVEVGQPVAAGAVLGRIDDAAIRDGVLSARAGVRAAEAAAAVARRNVARMEALLGEGAVAERALEDARTGALAAERGLMDARALLAQAEKQLGKTVLRAPLAGVVAERAVSAGDVVALGAPLFTVVDPASMELEASVPSEQLASVRVNAPVEFRVAGYAGQMLQGHVERVSPVADPVTRQVRIFVSIPNEAGRLVGGLFAEGRVATETREGLIAPVSAVGSVGAGGAATVLRLRNGVVEQVPVSLGLRDGRSETVEITSGLAAGDTLLLGAARTLTPGTPVQVRAAAAAR